MRALSSLVLLPLFAPATLPDDAEPEWGQYQGDAESSGFALVRTDRVDDTAWTILVDDAPLSSPAIGHDGRSYVALTDRGLIAFDDLGDVTWVENLGEPGCHGCAIASTPAVDSDNSAYVIFTDGFELTSTLHHVSADGELLWSTPLPTFTTASVKLFGDHLFASTPDSHLYVVDAETGDLVLDERLSQTCPIVGQGPGVVDALETIVEIFADGWAEFDTSAPAGPALLHEATHPTLAVVELDEVVTLVVPQYCDVHFLRWSGTDLTHIDTFRRDNILDFASASAGAGGLVVLGSARGSGSDIIALGIDVAGTPAVNILWEVSLSTSSFPFGLRAASVRYPAAVTIRQIFVAVEERGLFFGGDAFKLVALDSNGELLASFNAESPIQGAPAASGFHVFFHTSDELWSLDWDLRAGSRDQQSLWSESSVAIGDDGRVVASAVTEIVAYERR